MKPYKKNIFVIHKHQATHLHYDLRLEIEGTLKSWALRSLPTPASPSVLAIQVPDHPFWYRHFEGVIPEGQYGAGPVMIWDKGLYTNFMADHTRKRYSLTQSLHLGCLLLRMEGHKLNSNYILVRTSKKQHWRFIIMDDTKQKTQVRSANWHRSVKSGKTLKQIFNAKISKE